MRKVNLAQRLTQKVFFYYLNAGKQCTFIYTSFWGCGHSK